MDLVPYARPHTRAYWRRVRRVGQQAWEIYQRWNSERNRRLREQVQQRWQEVRDRFFRVGESSGQVSRVEENDMSRRRSGGGRLLRGEEQQSGGGSHKSVTVNHGHFRKSTKKLQDLSEEYTYKYTTVGNIFNATPGQQTPIDFPFNGVGAVPAYGLGSVGDLQQVLLQMGIAVASQAGYHFTVPFQKLEAVFTNTCNYPIFMWIYDVVPRANIFNSPGATNTPFVYSPVSAWKNGYIVEGGTGTDQSGTVFSTPFESKLFCEWYRVIGVKRVVMGAGDVHIHKVINIQKNWMTDSKWRDLAAGSGSTDILYLENYTVNTIVVLCGTPIHDSTAGHTTDQGRVSTGPVRVDYVATKEYIGRSATYNQRTVTRSASMGNIATGAITNVIANNQADANVLT